MLDELDEEKGLDIAELLKTSEGDVTPGSQPETTDETPAPSPEEQKAETDSKPEDPASKKEVPFHKNPRWIRMQQELDELRAFRESVKVEEEKPVVPTQAVVPKEFQHLFGEDVESYKAWQTMLRTEAEGIYLERQRAEARAQQEQKSREETAKQKAVAWAEDQFTELSDELGVDLTDQTSSERNQVLDIVIKYGLFDREGRPKIREANELRLALYPAQTDTVLEEKKRVIAKTNAKSNVAPKEDTILTSSKLKKMDISQFFN